MNAIATVVLVMFLVCAYSMATASAFPAEKPKPPPARLVKNDYVHDNSGQYSLNYQLDDGTSQSVEGTLVLNDEGDDYVMIQKGSYSYVSPEGIKVNVSYVADKDGFKLIDNSMPPKNASSLKY